MKTWYARGRMKGTPLSPSLSLLLPVHNAEQSLADQVHRLLELLPELTGRFEILVIDDASTDQTLEVADELARQYPQLRVMRSTPQRGTEAVVQAAMKRATGDFVFVLESGRPIQGGELRRLWKLHSAPSVPSRSAHPRPIPRGLLERLVKWGEQLSTDSESAAAAPKNVTRRNDEAKPMTATSRVPHAVAAPTERRPTGFLAHLRDLAVGE